MVNRILLSGIIVLCCCNGISAENRIFVARNQFYSSAYKASVVPSELLTVFCGNESNLKDRGADGLMLLGCKLCPPHTNTRRDGRDPQLTVFMGSFSASNKEEALIADDRCGGDGGYGGLTLLRRKDKIWKIIEYKQPSHPADCFIYPRSAGGSLLGCLDRWVRQGYQSSTFVRIDVTGDHVQATELLRVVSKNTADSPDKDGLCHQLVSKYSVKQLGKSAVLMIGEDLLKPENGVCEEIPVKDKVEVLPLTIEFDGDKFKISSESADNLDRMGRIYKLQENRFELPPPKAKMSP